jgi:hypothetical protein
MGVLLLVLNRLGELKYPWFNLCFVLRGLSFLSMRGGVEQSLPRENTILFFSSLV